MLNFAKFHQSSIPNRPKWWSRALRSDPGSMLVPDLPKSEPPGCFFWAFWHHLGDFGRNFGPSWAPRGSKNQALWHQVAKKWKSHRYLMRKCDVLGMLNHGISNFTGELQCRRVFRLFHKSIGTSQKMYAKMDPKRLQNPAWRHLGLPFLRFWAAFGRCQMLMGFGVHTKWTH